MAFPHPCLCSIYCSSCGSFAGYCSAVRGSCDSRGHSLQFCRHCGAKLRRSQRGAVSHRAVSKEKEKQEKKYKIIKREEENWRVLACTVPLRESSPAQIWRDLLVSSAHIVLYPVTYHLSWVRLSWHFLPQELWPPFTRADIQGRPQNGTPSNLFFWWEMQHAEVPMNRSMDYSADMWLLLSCAQGCSRMLKVHPTAQGTWCFSMASHTSATNMGRSWSRSARRNPPWLWCSEPGCHPFERLPSLVCPQLPSFSQEQQRTR